MAMLKRTISMARMGGGLSYRSLSSGKSGSISSLNLVDTLGMVKGLEAKNVPSTQAEALTGAITGGLESVMERVKADIAKSEEYQSTRVALEVQKLRADIDKMRDDIATMQAERRYDRDFHIHKFEQYMKKDFNRLKAGFEETKYEFIKYTIYTLVIVAAVGSVTVWKELKNF